MKTFYHNYCHKIAISGFILLSSFSLCSFNAVGSIEDSSRTRKSILLGRAVLPAATFQPGPQAGKIAVPKDINGQTVPLPGQPVQGFSAVHKESDTTYWVMCDNGFGSMENSADFNLRVYNIVPNFKTKNGGTGTVRIKKFIELSDPDSLIPFSIANQFTRERILTGADFDLESMQWTKDNTIWFGDEFGPYLIHTDLNGKILEAPIALPDPYNPGKEIRSPQNQYYEEASAVRIMNAMNTSAKLKGTKTPVFSPNFQLIDDKEVKTGLVNRNNPPANSGLEKVSTEIFNVTSIKNAGYPVVAWTVNDSLVMLNLIKTGVSGIISDNTILLQSIVYSYDGNSDGKPDFIGVDGLIDYTKFDAQAHRGGRSLRPENTLPAMEYALDLLIGTLETDCGITADGIPVLGHDAYLNSTKFRKVDNISYAPADEVLIKDLTVAQLQSAYIGDKLLVAYPMQKNERNLSPVSVAFALENKLMDPYVAPTLQQFFDFVKFYSNYYKTGAGSTHPMAVLRSKNADIVRFNVETKRNPRSDEDAKGKVYKSRTVDPETFVKAIAGVIVANKLEDRADIQSFDFSTLLVVHKLFPQIRTVCLFSDGPVYTITNGTTTTKSTDDGTNLQPEPNGKTSPWLGGLFWPYRSTYLGTPWRAERSGGFEGMALDSTKENLLPLLELPLKGGEPKKILFFEFNLASKSYTGKFYKYHFSDRGTNIGDFVMHSKDRGLIIEREGSEGDLNGLKAVYEIKLNEVSKTVSKRLAVDLLDIRDTFSLTTEKAGDIGLGPKFSFPFVTIEDVVILSPTQIGVLNDNNYPGSVGRHLSPRVSDDNEFIIVELDRAIGKEKMAADDTLGYYPKPKVTGLFDYTNVESIVKSITPNPFTHTTKVSLSVPSADYSAVIFNNFGQKVKTLSDSQKSSGFVDLIWNATDEKNVKVAPGMYHLQINCNGQSYQDKIILID